jgi:hypothetical protein
MISEVRTKGGLTIRNYTRYDTEDILAVAQRVENELFPNGRVELSEWAPNGVMAVVHAVGQPKSEVRVRKGRIETRVFKARVAPFRSSRSGTLMVAHPKIVFDNSVEDLCVAFADEKRAPSLLAADIASVITAAYSQRSKPLRSFEDDGSWDRIRIYDTPVATRPKDGKSRERKALTGSLNRVSHTLGSAGESLKRAGAELGAAGLTEHEAELMRLSIQMFDLRDRVKRTRLKHIPPTLTPSQDKDNT